jgi:hypothetical protein
VNKKKQKNFLSIGDSPLSTAPPLQGEQFFLVLFLQKKELLDV